MKTARFSAVVAHSGRPKVHLLWSAAAKDRVVQAALKQHRLLTVHQLTRGQKKDFGFVGLEPDREAQLLIFPKSLRPFIGRRVVGIQYDLISEGVSVGPKGPAPTRPKLRLATKATADRHSARDPKKEKAASLPTAKVLPEPMAFEPPEPVETDPVRAGIRRALADLEAGHSVKAKRQLRALLDQA